MSSFIPSSFDHSHVSTNYSLVIQNKLDITINLDKQNIIDSQYEK